MFKILIITLYLLLLIGLGSKMFRNYLVTPQFAFTISFLPSLLFLNLFVEKWEVDLCIETIGVLMAGPTLFLAFSIIIGACIRINKKPSKRLHLSDLESLDHEKLVQTWKLLLLIIVQVIAVILMGKYVLRIARGGSISQILYSFRMYDITEFADIPTVTSQLRVLAMSIGMYLIFYYFINRKEINRIRKKNILFICSFLLLLIISVMMGNRGKMIEMIAFAVTCAVFTSLRYNKISRKVLFRAAMVMVLLIISLRLFANLVGRGVTMDWADYIGIYLSASIKNLDTAIRTSNFGIFTGITEGGISNNITFGNILNWIALTFGISSLYGTRGFNEGYQIVNGHELGNVYTTYLPFLQDGGFFGVIVYIFIIVVFSKILYKKALLYLFEDRSQYFIYGIIYSRIYSFLLFSFFSQYFYWTLFQIEFFMSAFYFVLIDIFVRKNIGFGLKRR